MPAHALPELSIVCGLPGVGKTTLARELEQASGAVRFAPDEWMLALSINLHDQLRRAQIEELQWAFGKQLLTRGLSVIVEWGTWGRSERDRLRVEATALGAAVHLHYLQAPSLDLLFARLQRRNAEDPPILREALEEWARLFQAPLPEEQSLFERVSMYSADSAGWPAPNLPGSHLPPARG